MEKEVFYDSPIFGPLTKEEYQQFVTALKDRPVSYMAFETLYWCGLRLGELLALTPADFDFENKIIYVTGMCFRLHRWR